MARRRSSRWLMLLAIVVGSLLAVLLNKATYQSVAPLVSPQQSTVETAEAHKNAVVAVLKYEKQAEQVKAESERITLVTTTLPSTLATTLEPTTSPTAAPTAIPALTGRDGVTEAMAEVKEQEIAQHQAELEGKLTELANTTDGPMKQLHEKAVARLRRQVDAKSRKPRTDDNTDLLHPIATKAMSIVEELRSAVQGEQRFNDEVVEIVEQKLIHKAWKHWSTGEKNRVYGGVATGVAMLKNQGWLIPPPPDGTSIELMREDASSLTSTGATRWKHFSQWGQDALVDSLLREKQGGFFVEAGAFDGETHSNTLFLEQQRGWSGVLVEANPHLYS